VIPKIGHHFQFVVELKEEGVALCSAFNTDVFEELVIGKLAIVSFAWLQVRGSFEDRLNFRRNLPFFCAFAFHGSNGINDRRKHHSAKFLTSLIGPPRRTPRSVGA